MTTNHSFIYHLFIVDISFRSARLKSNLISQVNDSLDSIRHVAKKNNTQQHRITLMSIKNNRIKCACHDMEVDQARDFSITDSTASDYIPLLDAIGTSIATWRALGHRRENSGKYQVSIFTSGKDRGSKKYSVCTLKSIITALITSGWQFTLIGANPLLPQVAENLGIPNYYNCGVKQSSRERNFLISRLKKQWQQQQVMSNTEHERTRAA